MHEFRQDRMNSPQFLDHAKGNPTDGEVGIPGAAQLAEVIGLTQVELRKDAAIVSIWDNVLRDARAELTQTLVRLSRFPHGPIVSRLEPSLCLQSLVHISPPRRQ